MWIDITDLDRFYKSRLGIFTTRVIQQHILKMWALRPNDRILGLGYTIPYFKPFQSQTETLIAAMPSYQGASPWPQKTPCKAVMVHEQELPFQDQCFDRVMLVHIMGYTVHVKQMLREVWRVLKDNGELLLVVPNRFGFWSHMDKTPFGKSMPYSTLQLKQILVESCFSPGESQYALYVPPVKSQKILSIISPLETISQKWIGFAPGVIIMNSVKQVYAPTTRLKVRRWKPVLAPEQRVISYDYKSHST